MVVIEMEEHMPSYIEYSCDDGRYTTWVLEAKVPDVNGSGGRRQAMDRELIRRYFPGGVLQRYDLGMDMELVYCDSAVENDPLNPVAKALCIMADVRQGPRRVVINGNSVDMICIRGTAIVMRKLDADGHWRDLSPFQREWLRMLLGEKWFDGNDYSEVVLRNGDVRIGREYVGFHDDYCWEMNVLGITRALVRWKREHECFAVRSDTEGQTSFLFEEDGMLKLVMGSCVMKNVMSMEKFAEKFTSGMRRYLTCSPGESEERCTDHMPEFGKKIAALLDEYEKPCRFPCRGMESPRPVGVPRP